MNTDRIRRAAEIIRREAGIIRSSKTTLGGHWPNASRLEQRQHDEMLSIAKELDELAARPMIAAGKAKV